VRRTPARSAADLQVPVHLQRLVAEPGPLERRELAVRQAEAEREVADNRP